MFAILIFGPGHAAINFLCPGGQLSVAVSVSLCADGGGYLPSACLRLLLAILDDALGMIIIAAPGQNSIDLSVDFAS